MGGFGRHQWCGLGFLLIAACSKPPTPAATPNTFFSALPKIAVSSPAAEFQAPAEQSQAMEVSTWTRIAGFSNYWNSIWGIPKRTEKEPLRTVDAATHHFRDTATQDSLPSALLKIKLLAHTKSLDCFGKGKAFSKHADGGTDSSTRGGETGIEEAFELTEDSRIACPAAVMNEKLSDLGGLVNQAIQLSYLSAAALKDKKLSLPNEKQTIGANLPQSSNIKDGYVTLEKIATEDGPKYIWRFNFQKVEGPLSLPIQLSLSNTQMKNGEEKGRFWGTLPRGTDVYAFSLTYHNQGERTAYELRSAQSKGSSRKTNFFKANGLLNFDSAAAQQNLFFAVANLDSKTGLGSMRSTWSSANTDPRAKVLEIQTEKGEGQPDHGIAYFGFGPTITDKNIANQSIAQAQSMICAWSAGAKSFTTYGNAAEQKGKVQAMELRRNGLSGQFEPVLSSLHISYCPTQSCNGAPRMLYGGQPCDKPHQLARVGQFGKVTVETPIYQ